MNFYTVKCQREKKVNDGWIAIGYISERLIIVAENDKDAIEKVNTSLDYMSNESVRCVKNGEIYRCHGLYVTENLLENSSFIIPV